MQQPMDSITIRWAGNRAPILVLLDDPTPCRNPAWYEFPDQGHVAEVPNAFTERFADVIERTGAAGKFSVVPCPGAQGRIDEAMPGIDPSDITGFARIVRERIAPRWDVCPELMTHNKAMDLATMRPLPEREDVWASHQDEASFTAYISLALQILRNIGLEPNGVTSPWQTGIEVEDAYAAAISTALRDVCDVRLGWYFLHLDSEAPSVPPRMMRLQPESGTALVSIVSGSPDNGAGGYDFAWRTQFGEPAALDWLLTADGSAGRIARLYDSGGPITFHTHWQSMFSNGSGAGLAAFDELCTRISRSFGERVYWTAARELARYCAAKESTTFTASAGGHTIAISAPFACPEFTVSVPVPAGASSLSLDGMALERLPDGTAIVGEGCWSRDGATALVSIPLRDGAMLAWN